MPKIRILRGSYRQSSGERAEPGDVITVDEDTLERLNSPSYELLDTPEQAEEEPEPEDEEPDPNSPGPETVPENSTTDEPQGTKPVKTGDEKPEQSEVDEDEDDDGPEEDVESPKGAQTEDVGDRTPTPDVPDDYAMLSKMAKIYEGDEVHGSMSGDQITSFFESLSPTEVNGLKRRARNEMG